MMKVRLTIVIFSIVLMTSGFCEIQGCQNANQNNDTKLSPVDKILNDLEITTSQLKSYQCKIEYNFSQPLLDSRTFRTGQLFYEKNGKKSSLRIDFNTLKEDDEKTQKYVEHIVFDGVWLTHIDYQTKHAKKIQQAELNSPIDAFELANQNFPIIGFTQIGELKKQFEITLVNQATSEPNSFIQLLLKVKPDSIYKDEYTQINFKIDKNLNLPAVINATTVDDENYEIKLTKPKLNKKLPGKIFEAKVPENFDIEITPLKEKGKD